MAAHRFETGYRNVTSTNGVFSPHISRKTAERLTRYCKQMNLNKTKFVELCINERLDILERQMLENFSKAELINMILGEKKETELSE